MQDKKYKFLNYFPAWYFPALFKHQQQTDQFHHVYYRSFRLKNKRPFGQLLLRDSGGCTKDNPGIGDIKFVKDLQAGKVVTRTFRCSIFSGHLSPLIGWVCSSYHNITEQNTVQHNTTQHVQHNTAQHKLHSVTPHHYITALLASQSNVQCHKPNLYKVSKQN